MRHHPLQLPRFVSHHQYTFGGHLRSPADNDRVSDHHPLLMEPWRSTGVILTDRVLDNYNYPLTGLMLFNFCGASMSQRPQFNP